MSLILGVLDRYFIDRGNGEIKKGESQREKQDSVEVKEALRSNFNSLETA